MVGYSLEMQALVSDIDFDTKQNNVKFRNLDLRKDRPYSPSLWQENVTNVKTILHER